MKANLDATSKDTAALEKGMAGAFLQTSGAACLRQLAINMDLSPCDRDVLVSFLSQAQGQASGCIPASGEIVGILKQMKDTVAGNLKEIIEAEEKSKADLEERMKVKSAQIQALTQEIEEKAERLGNTKVELVG